MIDATGSPSPGRELAAGGRDGRATAMLDAPVPLARREAHAGAEAVERPQPGRKRPGRARSPLRTREIVASIIGSPGSAKSARPVQVCQKSSCPAKRADTDRSAKTFAIVSARPSATGTTVSFDGLGSE